MFYHSNKKVTNLKDSDRGAQPQEVHATPNSFTQVTATNIPNKLPRAAQALHTILSHSQGLSIPTPTGNIDDL